MKTKACVTFQMPKAQRQQTWHVPSWLANTLEIGIGAICSAVTWKYTVESERGRGDGSDVRAHIANP